MAVVTADIAPGQLAFGERSGSAGQARQMLFEAGDSAVDLRITTAGDKFDIRGQILGDGFDNASITLTKGALTITATAENASFTLRGIPAGKYVLTATGSAAEIVIEQLLLK